MLTMQNVPASRWFSSAARCVTGALSAAAVVAAVLLASSVPTQALVTSGGKFVDSGGVAHPWRITESHVLVWDDKPWVPVGGRFQAKFWDRRATDADFESDTQALQALRAQGVTDLLVQPSRGGLTDVPVERIQRLLDYLDAQGFTYGLSISDGPQEPLLGYDVRPGKYRTIAPEQGGLLRFQAQSAVSGLYFVATESGEMISSGDATRVDEGLRVTIGEIPGRTLVYALPQKAHLSAKTIGVPNVWEGFDTYRDTLMSHLRRVKWGSGLRFWVDGLGEDVNPGAEAESFLPSSTAFQTEFAQALARRYKSVDELENRWAIADRELRDFKQAAALIPLWGAGKGVQYFHDPLTEKQYRVDTNYSQFWRDLNRFKTESLRAYMNDMATILKKTVADVPVVYRSRGYSPLFANLPAGRGFDGIGIEAWGQGSELATRTGGYVYAQAVEANKTVWLPVVATADAAPGQKTAIGYSSRIGLHKDLDWLREIGARGFYVDGVRLTDPARKAFDLGQTTEQVGWLADYGRAMKDMGLGGMAPPPAVFYPRGLPLASLRPLQGGGWWLPTERRIDPNDPTRGVYDFGASGRAYALPDDNGTMVYYLWNPHGKKTIRIKIPKAPKGTNPAPIGWSKSAQASEKHGVLTITIGPEPILLTNFPTVPVPLDAFRDTLEEAALLTRAMRRRSQVDAGRFEIELAVLDKRYNEDNPMPTLMDLQRVVANIRDLVRPYAWLEAEKALAQNFDTISEKMGASDSRVLAVEARGTGAALPLATYQVDVRTQGQYSVWVAASPNAPLSFRLDGTNLLDEALAARPTGSPYADGTLVWTRLGTATLPRGSHTLEMRASGPALVDTILLIQGEFTPNGTVPPPIKP